MSWRTFGLLQLAMMVLGATFLWWFKFPDPGEALADSITAGATAAYAEIMAIRLGWWR